MVSANPGVLFLQLTSSAAVSSIMSQSLKSDPSLALLLLASDIYAVDLVLFCLTVAQLGIAQRWRSASKLLREAGINNIWNVVLSEHLMQLRRVVRGFS